MWVALGAPRSLPRSRLCRCACVCVRLSVSPASEKALLRDSSPASGTDRDSPEPLLKADPDHKELDSKSPDEIILEESDSEEGKKEGEAVPGAAGTTVGATTATPGSEDWKAGRSEEHTSELQSLS